MQAQLDFFKTDEDELREEVANLKISHDKQRRAMFAKITELSKICYDLNHKVEILVHLLEADHR